MRRSRIVAVVLAILVPLPAASVATTQDATPVALPQPIVPDPAECTVAPRPVEFFEQFLATPGTGAAASPAASPVPTDLPAGEPADPETVEAVTATVRQILACLNAGDTRRAASLFTDDYFARLFAQSGRLPPEQLAAIAGTPVAAPGLARTLLLAVRAVRVLADDRVGAIVVTDDPVAPPAGPQAAFVVFAEQDGRWLVDEPIRDLGSVATPTP